MSGWDTLDQELARWRDRGRAATLWWRDDDAGPWTAALERLLAMATRAGVPLALAAVPAWLSAETAARVLATPRIRVLQHGEAHRNHAPPDAKKCEFPLGDPGAAARIQAGRARLGARLGVHALPILVPPWNRIDPDLVPRLPGLGIRALSTYRARGRGVPGLALVNTHADIIDWERRAFLGADAALALLAQHLAARREGRADAAEPTGLLTHHAVHDADAWAFLERLMDWLAGRATVSWPDPLSFLDSPA